MRNIFHIASNVAFALLAGAAHAESILLSVGDSMGSAVIASPSGARVSSYDGASRPKIWNTQTGEIVAKFGEEGAFFDRAAYRPDGGELATLRDGVVEVWNARSGDLLRRFDTGDPATHSLMFGPASGALFTWGGEGELRLHDAQTGAPRLSFAAAPGLRSVPFILSDDGRRLIVQAPNGDGRIGTAIWNVEQAERQTLLALQPGERPELIGFGAGGRSVVTFNRPNLFRVWSAEDGRPIASLKGADGLTFEAANIALTSDGALLAALATSGDVLVWNIENGSIVGKLQDRPQSLHLAGAERGRNA